MTGQCARRGDRLALLQVTCNNWPTIRSPRSRLRRHFRRTGLTSIHPASPLIRQVRSSGMSAGGFCHGLVRLDRWYAAGLSRYALRRDRFEAAPRDRRAEQADNDEHDHHRAGDEAEHADCAVAAEEESNQEAGEDGAEPAPGIDKAHGLGADAGRIELGLVGVERKREPVAA